MSEASFAKHGIEIVRAYEDVPTLVTDRHKVLQVLVNVVTNARHAMREDSGQRNRLVARVHTTARGIAIAITDTGIGIPPENLARIFQHGFTTKADGHGFGLHASGNAVREIGGSIAVTSEGAGKGATFIIELPLELSEKPHVHTS